MPMSSIPGSMIAIEISQPGGPEVLRAVTRPVPRPQAGEVLIEVAAAGVNRPDVMQRLGKYPPPPGASDIPGLEVAGRVAAMERGRPGGALAHRRRGVRARRRRRLRRILRGTGVAVPALAGRNRSRGCRCDSRDHLHRVDESLPARATASRREGSSPRRNQRNRYDCDPACACIRRTVFATAGSDAKCDACVRLGADVAINYRREDFVEVVREATSGAGVHAILDMVGGDYVARNLQMSRRLDGRLVQIGLMRIAR